MAEFEANTSLRQVNVNQSQLHSLGYHFNEDSLLTDQDGNRYKFTDYRHHEQVGRAITEEIYQMMRNPPYNMQKRFVNESARTKSSFIFVSEDWDKKDHLVVLIQGNGVIRAGQWNRDLIMTRGLDIGSQLPYIRQCQDRDWGVIVMNNNMNYYVNEDGHEILMPGSKTASEHGFNVWTTFVDRAVATSIAVIAHSAGGMVIADILEQFWSPTLKNRVKCVCLADAMFLIPHLPLEEGMPKMQNWLANQYVRVGLPVIGSTVFGRRDLVRYVSAGTSSHEEAPACSMEDIFRYIEKSFRERAENIQSTQSAQ